MELRAFRRPPYSDSSIPFLLVIVLSGGLMSVLPGSDAAAEWYVGGYGGLADPGALTNTTASSSTLAGGVQGARLTDLELQNNLVFGGKVGYFLSGHSWLGFETDAYSTRTDIKMQPVIGGVPGGKVFADMVPATPLRMTAGMLNVIIRSPSLSECFQPYGGAGYGGFLASSTTAGHSTLHLSPGFNLVAGARYVITERLSLFGEFKYSHTTVTVQDFHGDYSAQLFVGGLVWHFKQKTSATAPVANPSVESGR
jgi:opacity protein-like surface antigen